MKTYKWLYIAAGVVVSYICVAVLIGSVLAGRWIVALASTVVCVLWWYGLQRLRTNSPTLSLAIMGLASCLLLIQLYNRRRFVIQNGGWEGPDGFGSPVAFFLALMTEIFLFLCFFTTTMVGVRAVLAQRTEDP